MFFDMRLWAAWTDSRSKGGLVEWSAIIPNYKVSADLYVCFLAVCKYSLRATASKYIFGPLADDGDCSGGSGLYHVNLLTVQLNRSSSLLRECRDSNATCRC